MSFSNPEMLDTLPRLKKFALRLTMSTDRAEDLLHDTVVRMIEQRDTFTAGSALFSWASKVMFHIFVSRYRRMKKRETMLDPAPFVDAMISASDQETEVYARQVLAATTRLNDHLREVIVLAIEGFDYEEMAQLLDVPLGTIRSRLFRARATMSRMLDNPSFRPITRKRGRRKWRVKPRVSRPFNLATMRYGAVGAA